MLGAARWPEHRCLVRAPRLPTRRTSPRHQRGSPMSVVRRIAAILVPSSIAVAAVATPSQARAAFPTLSVIMHTAVPGDVRAAGDVEVTITGHDYEERGQFTSLNGFAISTLPPHGGVAGIPVDV